MHDHPHTHESETFTATVEGVENATPTSIVEVADGEATTLEIAPVAKQLGGHRVRMLSYNGSIPGPTLRVRQGSEITVDVTNRGDLDATVHWHGLRLDNRYDGTHETQAPIPVSGDFSYRLTFADPGLYWYHPHIREDYGQEMGLYGNILVDSADPDYWPPAHRELLLTLDDVLVEDGRIAPFSRDETNFAAMGRFGNIMLVAGETEVGLDVRAGEVVRLFLTNTANTRVFNVALPGAQLKLVGGDSGRCEREELVDSVVLAPSERAIVDAHFARASELTLEHRTPETTYRLATFTVGAEPAPPLPAPFDALRSNDEWTAWRSKLDELVAAAPDKTLAFVAEMNLEAPEGPVVYACPMHPDVTGGQDDRCPRCGMKLVAVAASFVCPMHPEVTSATADRCPKCGMKLVPTAMADAGHGHGDHASGGDGHAGMQHDGPAGAHAMHGDGDAKHGDEHHAHDPGHGAHGDGIEWEDDMVEVNRITTSANTRWSLVDRDTGAVNHGIDWKFRVGDQVKLRLVNEMDSDHPMHHPFHVHGAGRLIVLARDGEPEPNLVWKDTVLVRTGQTVDVLLDVTNAGRWMAHCHIAEHHESGMMFSFDVAPSVGEKDRDDR
jgi:FtsP/CotA-like multicopper oxidase with cupredoxin domain